MPRRRQTPRAGPLHWAAAIALVLTLGACDLVAPKDRQHNSQVQTPSVGAIDASTLRPGQHLAGALFLELNSLGAGGLSSPIVTAALYVDDSLHSQTQTSGPPFLLRLDTRGGGQGPHQLTVFVYEADPNLGLGGLVGSPSQVLTTDVVFDQTPPTPVTLTSVVWDHGAPRLTWSQNADANFAAYRIVRDGNWGFHLPFPRPVTNQATVTVQDTLALDQLIGARYTYRVDVDNRNELAPSNSLSLAVGDAVPGLHFTQGEPRPVAIPNSNEFYTYGGTADSLKVFSSSTQSQVRGFRPPGGSIAISRDGSTFILLSDVLLNGIPGLATYSATSLGELGRLQMTVRLGGYSTVAGRADRLYAAGFDELFVVRVSDAAVVGQVPLSRQQTRLAISPDANTLYVTTRDSVFRIDISTDTPQVLAALRVQPDIADLQLSPDGQRLYLLHTIAAPSNFVQVLDANTLASVGTLTPPGDEWLFAMHVTASHLYLSHARQDIPNRFFVAGSVVQYDRASLARLRSWDFVIVPSGVFGSADDQWFYASGLSAAWVVSTTSSGPQLAQR